jgi:hypothetical protein
LNLKSHQRTILKPLTFPLEEQDALTNPERIPLGPSYRPMVS